MTAADDRRERLERLRDQLAEAIEDAPSSILPQLAGQYRATLAELAALPVPEAKSARERLAERVSAANVVA